MLLAGIAFPLSNQVKVQARGILDIWIDSSVNWQSTFINRLDVLLADLAVVDRDRFIITGQQDAELALVFVATEGAANARKLPRRATHSAVDEALAVLTPELG